MSRLAELRQKAAEKKAAKKQEGPSASSVLSPDAASRETAVVSEEPVQQVKEAPAPKAEALPYSEAVPAKDRFTDDDYRKAASDIKHLMIEQQALHLSSTLAKASVGRTLDLLRVRPYYVEKTCLLSEGALQYKDGGVLLLNKKPNNRRSFRWSR
jgi:hypothetical protein